MSEPDGGLRARLVAVGVDLVGQEGTQALTLREIARRAGVSHGAPRRYFPTHMALLAAIAQEGYRHLGRQLTELIEVKDADPYTQILALSRLYLNFAAEKRGMFELMFRHDLLRGNGIGLRDEARPLFAVLVELIARAHRNLDDAPDPSVVAGALWAGLHGIAQLWQWGSLQVMGAADDVDALLHATVDAYVGPRS